MLFVEMASDIPQIWAISTDVKTYYYEIIPHINSNKLCAWRHNMPPPPASLLLFAFIRQVAPVLACWLFNTSATS